MTPTRHTVASRRSANVDAVQPLDDLLLEPMMGTPLAIYIEKDVPDRDTIVELVTVGCLFCVIGRVDHRFLSRVTAGLYLPATAAYHISWVQRARTLLYLL
jgi:hypothetical protein